MCPREISMPFVDARTEGDNNRADYSDVYRDMAKGDNAAQRREDTKAYYANLNNTLESNGTLPKTEIFGDINPGGVDQSKYGDCFFMASLASLSNSDQGRQTIRDMISTNDDGSYTVRFPGEKNAGIRVTDDDIREADVQSNGKWAKIAETAFLKYSNNIGGPQIQNMDLFGRIHNSRQSMELLTGESSIQTDQFAPTDASDWQPSIGATSKDNVAADLTDAFQNGRPVTASASAKAATALFGENNVDPAVDAHVYSVIGWDPKNQTVTLRNPWGQQNAELNPDGSNEEKTVDGITAKKDGTMTMSLDTFYSHFASITEAGKDDNISHLENTAGKIDADQKAIIHGLWTRDGGEVVDSARDLITRPQEAANESAYAATHWGWEKAKDVANDVNGKIEQAVTNPVDTFKQVVTNPFSLL